MNPEAEVYLERLRTIHQEIRTIVQGAPTEALNWAPTPKDTNSLAVLVTHSCGSESVFVHQALSGQDVRRVREAEFQVGGAAPGELLTLIEKTEARTSQLLEQEADLGRMVSLGAGRPPMSVRASLVRCIDHLATHVGHMQLTRQLYEARHAH